MLSIKQRAKYIVQWLDQCTYIEPHIKKIVEQYIIDHINEAIAEAEIDSRYTIVDTSTYDGTEYTPVPLSPPR